MKILIITLEYPPQIGGIASHTFNLADSMNASDIIVWAPKMQGDLIFDQQNPWKTFRGRPYAKLFWPRWLKWYFQIKKIIISEKVDLLVIQHALPGGYVGYMANKFLKIPYVVFFHGSDLEMAVKNKIRKLGVVCKNAKQVIVSSNFLKNKLLSSLGNLQNIVVGNPAPGRHFLVAPAEENKSLLKSKLALEGKKVIISVGRFDEGKGFPRLLKAMIKVSEQVPSAVLLLIGDGPKKNYISELIKKFNLENIVRYVGAVPNHELPIYYAISDLFVLLPHKDQNREEGWGMVYLESAACGVPAVAGNVGGVSEAIEDGNSGILVDSNFEKNTVEAIVSLLLDDKKRLMMGQYAKARVLRNFSGDNLKNIISA
jgi:phosphatidylinositol alpha-1,6-mannosyltransferase